MKGIVWHAETEGMTFDEIPVPADMMEDVLHWRQNLIEAVAEYDDKLMEKFFDNTFHTTISVCTYDLL
jgi:elongation factor G